MSMLHVNGKWEVESSANFPGPKSRCGCLDSSPASSATSTSLALEQELGHRHATQLLPRAFGHAVTVQWKDTGLRDAYGDSFLRPTAKS